MNVLVSSAGRRGALIRIIRDTLDVCGGGRVYAIDAAEWSSACRLADGWSIVPPFGDEQFFDTVVTYCRRHDIELIIPTHDRELPLYANLRPLFAELGIHVACSGPKTVTIATDKKNTHAFLQKHELPGATCIPLEQAERPGAPLPFPLVVKPSRGSGSVGVHVVRDHEELAFYLKRTPSPIVQRQAMGREFTTNMFVSQAGRCVVAVPHWRVETRGGEVSKCMTVRKECLIRLAHDISAKLPDAAGALCFQAFVSEHDEPELIEINARFGGGYPIAHHAGANFIQLLIQELRGDQLESPQWSDGMAMTRWDDAVFWKPEAA